jgi:hypothetical protein
MGIVIGDLNHEKLVQLNLLFVMFIEQDTTQLNSNEISVFWTSLVAVPIVWSVFALICVFTLRAAWLIVTLFALCMTAANLYGYMRCKWSSRDQLQGYLSTTVLKSVTFNFSCLYLYF